MGSVKIYGGAHANRNIQFLDDVSIRPTSSRARKVLFDWLRFSIHDRRCLDLFAGSGILGFEAMSQGAGSVLCIDHNPKVCEQIEHEIKRVGESELTVMCASIPAQLEDTFDIVLMDPPFAEKALYQETIEWVRPLVSEEGLLYIEADEFLGDIEHWELYKKKKISSVWMHLYRVAV